MAREQRFQYNLQAHAWNEPIILQRGNSLLLSVQVARSVLREIEILSHTVSKRDMETPTKIVYENCCMICDTKKIISKLFVVLTKSGEKKTEMAHKLENCCQLEIPTQGVNSRYICVCCKKKCSFFNFFFAKVHKFVIK